MLGGLPGIFAITPRSILLAFCFIASAAAEDAASASATNSPTATAQGWQFETEAYVWGPTLGGDTATGDDIDIGFDDIVDNLNFGLMGYGVARKGKLSFLFDAIYLDLETEDRASGNLVGIPLSADLDAELQGVIAAVGVGYNVLSGDMTQLDIIGGGQYFWLDADFDLKVNGLERKFSDSDHVFDGIVGFRGRTDLTDRLHLVYVATGGTGDSDYTWQVWGTLNYRLGAVDLAAGYRYLKWNFDDNRAFQDLNVHGPLIGAKIRF